MLISLVSAALSSPAGGLGGAGFSEECVRTGYIWTWRCEVLLEPSRKAPFRLLAVGAPAVPPGSEAKGILKDGFRSLPLILCLDLRFTLTRGRCR